MLNKKLIIAAATIAITGIGSATGAYIATRNNDTPAVSSVVSYQEVSSTVSSDILSSTTSIDTAIDKVSSEQRETSKIIQKTQNNVSEISSNSSLFSSFGNRDIKLDKVSSANNIEVIFNRVKIGNYNDNATILFLYQAKAKESLYPKKIQAADKNGKKLSMSNFGGSDCVRNPDTGEFVYTNQEMGLYIPASESPDLSAVTLTYEFENFDPVTVTFDIPIN